MPFQGDARWSVVLGRDCGRDYWDVVMRSGKEGVRAKGARNCRKLVLLDLGRIDVWVMPWQVIAFRLCRTTIEGDDSMAHLPHVSFRKWSTDGEKTFFCQIMMNGITKKMRTLQTMNNNCHFLSERKKWVVIRRNWELDHPKLMLLPSFSVCVFEKIYIMYLTRISTEQYFMFYNGRSLLNDLSLRLFSINFFFLNLWMEKKRTVCIYRSFNTQVSWTFAGKITYVKGLKINIVKYQIIITKILLPLMVSTKFCNAILKLPT